MHFSEKCNVNGNKYWNNNREMSWNGLKILNISRYNVPARHDQSIDRSSMRHQLLEHTRLPVCIGICDRASIVLMLRNRIGHHISSSFIDSTWEIRERRRSVSTVVLRRNISNRRYQNRNIIKRAKSSLRHGRRKSLATRGCLQNKSSVIKFSII